MRIERVISVYERNGEKLLREHSLNNISIEVLKKIIDYSKDDIELFDVYPISSYAKKVLSEFIPELSLYNEVEVELFYECYGE